MSNYNKFPSISVEGYSCFNGYPDILKELNSCVVKNNQIIAIETYPGVRDEEVIPEIKKLLPDHFVNMEEIYKDEETISQQMKYHLTDDRVFGKLYFGETTDFMEPARLEQVRNKIKCLSGLVVVYGLGAALACEYDTLVYLDLARWEIQMRYRKGMGNYHCANGEEDILRKFKRAYFIEWRVADKHKKTLLDRIDYLIDTNKEQDPKMITGEAFRSALTTAVNQPFRTVPYFDPGVWGGQWMKSVCALDPDKENYAWSFDGVPEENSLLFRFGDSLIELPAMDLVLYQPQKLLGEKVYARFGAEFPIRFDFLDTMDGRNLSLQVHPLTEYIRKQFGMAYTQDESYYILDSADGAVVYLGQKDHIDPDQMIADLERAEKGEILFDADKYINQFPAKKHDHFLIPAGTCHCSGTGTMVLEISATPYIFTFKLWDWGRVGLDGIPRPVHIRHGKQVIQWERTTEWVKENLVNAVREISSDENVTEEHTGLHELEFIETRRFWISGVSSHHTKGTVNMLNLIEGKEAIVESPDGRFSPFVVHYAETFIIPADIGAYTIRPFGESEGGKIGVIKAYVRGTFVKAD